MFRLWAVSDFILKKIKVPFHLVSQNILLTSAEKETLPNICLLNNSAEIFHTLRAADGANTSIRRVRLELRSMAHQLTLILFILVLNQNSGCASGRNVVCHGKDW